jgi:hypothetical protein
MNSQLYEYLGYFSCLPLPWKKNYWGTLDGKPEKQMKVPLKAH